MTRTRSLSFLSILFIDLAVLDGQHELLLLLPLQLILHHFSRQLCVMLLLLALPLSLFFNQLLEVDFFITVHLKRPCFVSFFICFPLLFLYVLCTLSLQFIDDLFLLLWVILQLLQFLLLLFLSL